MGIVSSRLSNRIKELCSPSYLQSQVLFSLEAPTITLRHVRTLAAEGSFFLQSYQSRTRSLVRILMGQTISKVFVAVPVMIALIYAARLEVATTGLGFHTFYYHLVTIIVNSSRISVASEVKEYYPHDHDG